jgi:thiamine biosynthesis lipoprotein ApbE
MHVDWPGVVACLITNIVWFIGCGNRAARRRREEEQERQQTLAIRRRYTDYVEDFEQAEKEWQKKIDKKNREIARYKKKLKIFDEDTTSDSSEEHMVKLFGAIPIRFELR